MLLTLRPSLAINFLENPSTAGCICNTVISKENIPPLSGRELTSWNNVISEKLGFAS
jgi:hypothetical protein